MPYDPSDPNSLYTYGNSSATSDPSAGQPAPSWPGVPYQQGAQNYPSNPIQTNQFGSALQESLRRLKLSQALYAQQDDQNLQRSQGLPAPYNGQYLPSASSLQQQPGSPVYPQFTQQSGQNGQGGAQPSTQSGQTGQLPNSQSGQSGQFQTPQGGLDYGALLRFYGINQQPNIRQSPFMSNDFMQNHPTLGGALNNALFAAAGTETARGASGAGTGISNVLRGVAGVPQAENQFQLQQQMQPFQMAEAMSKLYGQTASAQENLARAGWFSDRSGNQQLAIQQRADAAKAKFASPQYDQDNKLVGYMTPDGFLSAKDAGVPDNAQIYRPDPAGRGGNPTITSLAADVANGVPGAAARLKAAINANNQVAGGRQGAVNNANTPEKLLTSETQATLDQVGAAPKNAHADYQSYQAKQLMSGVPFEQVQDEATWSAQNTAKYNTAKAAAQQDVSNYTQSKAWQQGISLQQWKAIRARTALTPGVSQQAAPAGVPGTAQPQQAQRSNVQVGSKVTLKNGQTVTVTKLNNDGTFEHN